MKELNQTSENLKVTPVNKYFFDPIQELGLKANKTNKQDYEQLTNILTTILPYPSNELAELHMDSDRLGHQDFVEQINQRTQGGKQGKQARDNLEYCPCCGFIKQTQQLKVCTSLASINNIGISTFLYFKTIKNLSILLVVMTIVYSGYAFATNIIASGVYDKYVQQYHGYVDPKYNSTFSYVALSLGSKQLNQTDDNKMYYFIQCWLGLGMVTIWLLALFCIKYSEAYQQAKVEQQTVSASDFTLAIQNLPKDITKQQLQAQFDKYYATLSGIPQGLKQELKIAKINIGTPFYLNQQDFDDKQLDQLRKKHKQLVQSFIGWIQERQGSTSFSLTKDQRQKIYDQFQEVLKKEAEKYKQISEKIQASIKKQSAQTTTTVFVTLESSKALKLVAGLNDPSISALIRYYVSCCQGHNKFQFLRGDHNFDVKVERAPEPQDIIWTNLAVPLGEAVKRKIITFTVTFLLLGASFGIVYALSQAQKNAQDDNILSLVISICISVIGIILSIVIRKLSIYQRDYTTTKYQTSLAIKSIFAQLINTILIPMIVNKYIKDDLYGQNGLASDVFMLGLTNSLLPPILKIFNVGYIINRFLKYLASRPNSRLSSNQRQLNDTFEYLDFQVGVQYVYLVSLFLFICFFVSLQPIISLFGLVGLLLMYWAQKYSLFNRSKRPIPGTNLVNNAMFQLIIFGGIIYSLGSLTWSNFIQGGIPKQALLPNLIALGVSIALFLLPYRAILAACSKQEISKPLKFSDKRIILSSQYDRLNPVTNSEALKQFQQFYTKKFSTANEQEKKRLNEQIAKNFAKGHQKPAGFAGPNMMSSFLPGPAFMPPPPQMMMMNPQMMVNPQFAFRPQIGFQPPGFQPYGFQPMGFQQPRYQPAFQPPGFQPPGFQQPGFQQPGFQQPGFQQPAYRPVVQPQPPQQVFQQPNQNIGIQQINQAPGFRPAQGFGFQPPQQPQGFGFQPPQQPQGFGFQPPGFNVQFR